MAEKKEDALFSKIWTIPNLITFVRILLIPVFAVLFVKASPENNYIVYSIIILIISGLTDLFDGKIARRFNQISPLGKVLDPLADKLTQITIAILLFIKFRACDDSTMKAFSWVFLFFLLKEAIMVIGSVIMLLIGLRPGAAEIYGKVATFVFYAVMIMVITFGPEIGAVTMYYPNLVLPKSVMMILVIISAILTFIALCSYIPGTIKLFKERKNNK
ncbi:MAG TPA: CDP-alcohol phosphatidyltransferase family protein [Clostridiales bacterium]|nr:CDP-alcohol phosphatidyltransferase family protein [Clostridiales bacterium]